MSTYILKKDWCDIPKGLLFEKSASITDTYYERTGRPYTFPASFVESNSEWFEIKPESYWIDGVIKVLRQSNLPYEHILFLEKEEYKKLFPISVQGSKKIDIRSRFNVVGNEQVEIVIQYQNYTFIVLNPIKQLDQPLHK